MEMSQQCKLSCSLQTDSYTNFSVVCATLSDPEDEWLPRQAVSQYRSWLTHQLYVFVGLVWFACGLNLLSLCKAVCCSAFYTPINLLNRMSIFRENKHILPNNFLPSVQPSFPSVQNRTRSQGRLCLPPVSVCILGLLGPLSPFLSLQVGLSSHSCPHLYACSPYGTDCVIWHSGVS